MSTSTPFASSPLSVTPQRDIPKSQFTYKQLHQLKSFSTTTPLRVIAHVDLDAFYAQCEMKRLGTDPNTPLAVQQWQGLIAINYPARASGLTRHITCSEAKKLCPDIVLQHVATWKEGEEKWAYHDDAFKNMGSHKVSLDPYRIESRKILKSIKEGLPEKEQRVEKASVDEVFLDLSAQIHRILLERYPGLRDPPPYDDPTEHLPKPPTTVLDWKSDALVDMADEEAEVKDPDWDDVCLVIGSEIVRDMRQKVYDDLSYTCSAGVARNKMLAKLGSAYKKPNQQTVIRNRAITQFLSGFKFTKIRGLGGKLGDEVVAMFQTESIKDLLEQPLEQLKRLGDNTGTSLYSTIRGEDDSEVNPRTQLQSMLSAKSFRPSINSFEQGVRWLRIFVADIFSRCVEEGVLENRRRPKTITLHHKRGAQTKSRMAPIPQGTQLSVDILLKLATKLFAQVVADGQAWPCANLSLAVGGWEEGVTNNKSIRGFLVSGKGAQATSSSSSGSLGHASEPARKRRKIGNIANFFGPQDDKKKEWHAVRAVLMEHRESTMEEGDGSEERTDEDHSFAPPERSSTPPSGRQDSREDSYIDDPPTSAQRPIQTEEKDNRHVSPPNHPTLQQPKLDTFFCPDCNIHLPTAEKTSHGDYHFALDLSKQYRQEERTASAAQTRPAATTKTPKRGPG